MALRYVEEPQPFHTFYLLTTIFFFVGLLRDNQTPWQISLTLMEGLLVN